VACRCPLLPTVNTMAPQRSAADVADIDLLDRFDVDEELDIDAIVDFLGLGVSLAGVSLAGTGRRRR
jgi:hypothetical protein